MKRVIWFIGYLIVSVVFGSVSYAITTSFDIVVEPGTFGVGELADLTIKALDENGEVDAGYVSEAIIKVDGFDVMSNDVELPSLGYYQFKASDQGVKIFSKGFTNKALGSKGE